MSILPRMWRVGVLPGAVLAVLMVTGCGGPAAPARPSGSQIPAATSTIDSPGPQQWIQQFCGKPQEDAELYVSELKDAIPADASQTTVDDLEPTKESIYSTVSSGVDAPMTIAAHQLTATAAADGADAAVRKFLLGVYQRLHQALATAEDRIQALPTTDVNRFVTASSDVTGAVVSAVQDSKNAIRSNGTLGPIYTANPNCQ